MSEGYAVIDHQGWCRVTATSSGELEALRATLRRVLPTPAVDIAPQPDPGWRHQWPTLADLGLPAFCVTEGAGGFGLEVPAAVVAARELGAVLHGSPFAATTAAAFALSRWLDESHRPAAVQPLVAGQELATLAFLEPGGTIVNGPRGPRVRGWARLVPSAGEADAVVVVPPEGSTMVLVRHPGRHVPSPWSAFDLTRSFADVHFEDTAGDPIAGDPAGPILTERLHNLLTAADALGGVERSLERTTDYARERKAFGRPIGGFQAVQHRLVDHTLRVRGLSLLVAAAAQDLVSGRGTRRTLLAEAAVARHAVPILHDLVQLTGAIGFTWEHGLHYYERRAHLDARLGRNPRRAVRSLAAVEGWSTAGP